MLDKKLLAILVCPICQGQLQYQAESQELICKADGLAFPIRDDIPVMLENEARQLTLDEKLRINWGDTANNSLKIKIYRALIALPENKKIQQMDVSDPTKPTVK